MPKLNEDQVIKQIAISVLQANKTLNKIRSRNKCYIRYVYIPSDEWKALMKLRPLYADPGWVIMICGATVRQLNKYQTYKD